MGIQIHKTNFSIEAVVLKNATLIGKSSNTETNMLLRASTGLITPRTDGFFVEGITFCNYSSLMTAIQSCSQCLDGYSSVSGGRTTTFQGV